MTIKEIENNLPANMNVIDKRLYLKAKNDEIEIEQSGMNKGYLESIKNYAFRIIRPYIENPNYKG